MCGILGAISLGSLNKTMELKRKRIASILFTDMFQLTQDRGEDAAGAAVLFDDGKYYGVKGGVTAMELLAKSDTGDGSYGGFLKMWRDYDVRPRMAIGHCRKRELWLKLHVGLKNFNCD